MAYTVPTAANLIERFPAFSAVDTAVIDARIVEAQRMVDESWTEGDYAMGLMLYACHLMVLDGLGTGAQAQANAAGAAGFKSIRSGALSLDRGDAPGAMDAGGLDATTYGQRFRTLLRQNRGGPRLARADVDPYNPLAFE